MLDANRIKAKLIDFLLQQNNCELIASEVSFYHGYRKADIVQLGGASVTAFEIKSDKDNLATLEGQLTDYANTFSFCYLVTTQKHLTNVRKLASEKVGLILVTNQEVRVLRKPAENKRLCKHSLTLGLTHSCVNKLTKGSKIESVHDRRMAVEASFTIEILRQNFYISMIEKYKMRFNNFMSDRGSFTSLSDLYYLQA